MFAAAHFGCPPARPRTLVAPESWLLAAICLLDLLTTCYWIRYRDAIEGNPLMAWYLASGGTLVFVGIKGVLCALPLFVAEWARRARPRFVHAALRLTIAAYLVSYGAGVTHLNRQDADEAELARISALVAQPARLPADKSLWSLRPQNHRRADDPGRRQGWLAGPAGVTPAAAAAATTTMLPLAE